MPDQLDQERQERLMQFFRKSEEWRDLKQEIQQIYNNCDNTLKAKSCDNREWFAGGCAKVKEILDLEEQFK